VAEFGDNLSPNKASIVASGDRALYCILLLGIAPLYLSLRCYSTFKARFNFNYLPQNASNCI